MVSVIIPNYNHAQYLKDRIESVLQQSYKNYEIIILDDFSSDNSREIIEQYKNHPQVSRVVYNQHNSGSPFSQWNLGIELAVGDYIWVAESDDLAEKEFLAELMLAFQNDASIGIAYCQSAKIDERNEINGSWLSWTSDLENSAIFEHSFSMQGTAFIKSYLLYKNVIPNASAVVFKKQYYLSVGGANADVKYCGDWYAWLKILTAGNIGYSEKLLNKFRYHERSVIRGVNKEKDYFIKKYDIRMRKRYHRFLKSIHANDLLSQSHRLLQRDLAAEALFCIRNKKYSKAAGYYLARYFY